MEVLNLIITGIPSILKIMETIVHTQYYCFKPYYNWNTFNTPRGVDMTQHHSRRFKPYYNWNTFNTMVFSAPTLVEAEVLNLIITGIPSIPRMVLSLSTIAKLCFKPYYNWNTFNTSRCL